MIRVADYVIGRLSDEGVKHIFMVTGRGILFLSDAVARNKNIKSICVHHEQSAAFAAMAYAQTNEQLGACLVSTGVASTNAITGLLCAWQDDIPCVFISGQNKLAETSRYTGIPVRTYGQQEADIISIVKPITKYATMLTDAEMIGYELDKAFDLANSGRKGPVWIDIPLDLQNMRIEPEGLKRYDEPKIILPGPSRKDLEFIKKEIEYATRPAILIGSGIRSAGAVEPFIKLVEKLRIPVTFAATAVDVYGAYSKLSIGSVGSLGSTRAGNFTVQNSDLLIIIGHRLSTITTGEEVDKFARAAKKIVIDIDKIEHSKHKMKIDYFIESDAGKFVSALLEENIQLHINEWLDKCLHWKKVFPKCESNYKKSKKVDIHFLGECLSNNISEESVIITDAGLEELIIPSTICFKEKQRCVHPASQGSMGYALPASIGAYYANLGDVIAVIGDGSVMMNLQELQTISYNDIPVKIIIVNNNAYSVIRKRQVELFRRRTIGTDEKNGVNCPDFEKVANSFDIKYMKISETNKLDSGLKSLMDEKGPVICEVIAVEDQEYLRNAYGHNAQRRIVRRPIEDQAPFLDRDIIKSEMIIDPIDL